MQVYCYKKLCKYNEACCSKSLKDIFLCKKDDIVINNEVECDFFEVDLKKIDQCIKCSRRTGIIRLNPNNIDRFSNVKVNITESTIKEFKNIININKDNKNNK